ncbi:MAG: alpha-amylase [Deltaproteobacteria bacterium]|nr:alpha-amylase [Deltaproteobacteria bacterium]
MTAPIIYNLFPRLAGPVDRWVEHARRAHEMGFDWLFLNPVTQPGFSGSLYAVREHDKLNRDFMPAGESGSGMDLLADCLGQIHELGLKVMMDLVINHTAIDSPLVEQHLDWYKRDEDGEVLRPSAIDPADARNVTVWGDLAEIDNEASSDRVGLWAYWTQLVTDSLELGFDGFRCDAAYKVPAALWRQLVEAARAQCPEVKFFAETLGCRLDEVADLAPAGMDYLFNSSKYWNFDAPWALSQHAEFGRIAPSISFPESHDTPRLMADTGGNLAVQRQRYNLASVFSEGLLMPMGYEFGFSVKMDVVQSKPQDWEETETDLSGFIRSVNHMKRSLPALGAEGHLLALGPFDRPLLVLEKRAAGQRCLFVINKDWYQAQELDLADLDLPAAARLIRFRDFGGVEQVAASSRVTLGPAEIAWLVDA